MTQEKLSLRKVIIFLGLFSFFRPTIFEKFEITNALFNGILILILLVCFVDSIRRKVLPNRWFIIIASFYYGVLLYSTVIHNGSMSRALMIALTGYFTIFFVKYLMNFDFAYPTRVMRGLLWFYVFINLITILLFPNGLVTTGNTDSAVYFLGQPTRFAFFYLPALLFCILGDINAHGKISLATIIIFIICLSTLIAAWSVGSSIAFLALAFFLVFHKLKMFNIFTYIIVQAAAYVSLVYFHIQELFAFFIEDYLHKDATLSSRTYIWLNSLNMIEDSPLFGAGVFDNAYNKDVLGFVHAHNHLLHVTFQSGYLGLGLFVLLIIIGYFTVHHFRSLKTARILAFFIFMIGIQLLVDTVDGVRNHYLLKFRK